MASLFPFAVILCASLIVAFVLAGESAAREIRPSDHGLVFQNSPPAGRNLSMDMRSFFNSESASPTSTSSDMALPKATNSSDSLPPSWWKATRGGGGGGDHLGGALMVASVVCGVAGVVLLVASGLLYLFNKHRKPKPKLNESFRGGDNDNGHDANTTNKLQLVVRNP